jgi:hypothetical protein
MFIAPETTGPALRQEGHVLFISEEFENIFGFVSYIELLQHRQVFILEALLRVMLLLVANVPNYGVCGD